MFLDSVPSSTQPLLEDITPGPPWNPHLATPDYNSQQLQILDESGLLLPKAEKSNDCPVEEDNPQNSRHTSVQ